MAGQAEGRSRYVALSSSSFRTSGAGIEWVLTDAIVDTAKPRIIDDRDVILKVTGSTVCGSDLHLLHGMGATRTSTMVSRTNLSTGVIIQLKKGDILGHEFCGIVDQIGLGVKKIRVGKRYVAAFQITCGEVRSDKHCPLFATCLFTTNIRRQCFYCKQKLTSQCEKTNSNTTAKAMYGAQSGAFFGYSHFTGGFAGGQAEYVRVPIGDVNLLEIPDDVPDEKGMFVTRLFQCHL